MISNTENQANMGGEKIMQEQHHGQQRLGIYLTQVLLHKGRAQLRPKTRQWTVSTGLFFNIKSCFFKCTAYFLLFEIIFKLYTINKTDQTEMSLLVIFEEL